MAVVPMRRGPRPPENPLEGVSQAHMLMAIGQLYQNGDLFDPTPMDQRGRQTEAPTEPGDMYKFLKDQEAGMEQQQQFSDEEHMRNAPMRPTEKIKAKK